MSVTLEEVFNGAMKTVKISRYFKDYLERVFVSPVRVREEKIARNAQNVRALELL